MRAGIKVMNTDWSEQQLTGYLKDSTTPLRLACINKSGFPAIVPLWYHWDGEAFWCATHENAQLLKYLKSSPEIGFEIANNEPPYKGVRGQGSVQLLPDEGNAMIDVLLHKYLPGLDNQFTQWLLARKEQEVAIKVYPHTLSVWDYSKRMQLPESLS